MKSILNSPTKAIKRSVLLGGLAALAVTAGANRASAVNLTFDLRAASVTGAGSVITSEKTVSIADVNSVVTFNVWAVVYGADADPTNEGLQIAYFNLASNSNIGGFVGGLTGLDGSLAAKTGMSVFGNFSGSLFQRGVPNIQVTGPAAVSPADNVTDIGASSSGANTAANMIRLQNSLSYGTGQDTTMFTDGITFVNGVRTASRTGFTTALNGVSGDGYAANTVVSGALVTQTGREFLVGQVKLVLSTAGTSINFNVRLPASFATGGSFYADNLQGSSSSGNKTTLADMSVNAVGVAITAVPEPSAFGMLALGALGLVGFRRMGLRRTA